MNPTPEQVAAQVAAMVRKRPDARIVGIHADGGWAGGESIAVNGTRWAVTVCRSPLEVSDCLSSTSDGEGLVILTLLPDQALGLDVLARMAGRRLVRIDRWEMVREAFGAGRIDPRLPMDGWMADALLGAASKGGVHPAPNGWLGPEIAWRTLLNHYLGLDSGSPDARDLVDWSVDAERVSRYQALDGPLRLGIRDRFAESAGALGEVFAATIETGRGSLLLPIGLVCEVLFAGGGRRSATLSQAIARLEPLVGGHTLTGGQGQAWYQAARGILDGLPADRRQRRVERAERLLGDLRANRYAGLSTVFLTGFQQRLAAFGKALSGVLDGKTRIDGMETALEAVRRHDEAGRHPERAERLEMALRLVRRLEIPGHRTSPTLGEAVEAHLADGAFVDWARRTLLGGDPVEGLARGFGRLYRRVREDRETLNRIFAERLADWNGAPGPGKGFLPIEAFLDEVVAAVASEGPVLVVVIDGMDGGVFEELSEDLRHRGWVRWATPAGVGAGGLLSALPSMTAYSRTALLTGRMASGSARNEKSGFANHPALRSVSRPAKPPVLFHKGELTDAAAGGLSPAVRGPVADAERRIVGVVINAVDDHLAKSEQMRLEWTVESFRVLDALLYEARVAGRAVVLTADHGHVLEEDGRQIEGGEEERWRACGGPLSGQEMVFEGPRIKAATGMERVVLPWSEAVRYSGKKNGYHGGATPQEVVVPLGIFLGVGREPEGWRPLAESVPEWWLASAPAEVEAPRRRRKGGKRASSVPEAQGNLFETPEREAGAPASAWIRQLVDSEVYAAQLRLAGRLAPPTEVVREVLATLEARRDRVPGRVLAQAIQAPAFRLRGILAGLQRLLNVDGYQVLSVEEGTETVLLDRELLRKQFQLGDRT
ncbi:MAG: BREX-2 system phosphatase PglZ [Pseudomonadota bacterium]|nr:BREX-2 system phosphatase PglZ [Pseudomonadota bacterium]